MTTILALLCIPAWLYRGGSLPTQQAWPATANRRILTLAATPLAIYITFMAAAPLWWTTAGLLIAGAAAFGAAQADGWGRQMDLGSNNKPDDETGYLIRDLIFAEKSSFARDLTGLYMRMAQFIPAAIIWSIADPWFALPALFMVVFAPLVWVAEHVWIKPTPLFGKAAWTELAIGIGLAASTALAAALH